MMEQIRKVMLAPTARKLAPTFNLSQLAALCGIEKGSLSHRMTRGDLPTGVLNQAGTRREFTLGEARSWIREYRKDHLRPERAEAITISVGNFKGGVSKTTTAVTLAQGLSLLGHKVLVIDTDPQGSMTTLFGILPDTELKSRTRSYRSRLARKPRSATRFDQPIGTASIWSLQHQFYLAQSLLCQHVKRRKMASSSGGCLTSASMTFVVITT